MMPKKQTPLQAFASAQRDSDAANWVAPMPETPAEAKLTDEEIKHCCDLHTGHTNRGVHCIADVAADKAYCAGVAAGLGGKRQRGRPQRELSRGPIGCPKSLKMP